MQTIGIKELQRNPATLTRSLEAGEYTMITRRSKPLGIAVAFDDRVLDDGLRTSVVLDAYEKGLLSLGQLAQSLKLSRRDAMKMLSLAGIDVIDYDLEADLALAESL